MPAANGRAVVGTKSAGGQLTLGRLVRDARFVATVSDPGGIWIRERFPVHAGRVYRIFNGLARLLRRHLGLIGHVFRQRPAKVRDKNFDVLEFMRGAQGDA